jgi:hypothetical protein
MKAKSIKGNSPDEINEALIKATQDRFKPTLAIVFLSIKMDREAICNILTEKNISIFGATAGGEFIDEEIGPVVDKFGLGSGMPDEFLNKYMKSSSISLLLLDVDPNYFHLQKAELDGANDRAIAQSLGEESHLKFGSPGFLIVCSDHLNTDPEQLLRGLQDTGGEEINVFGAIAGDDLTFTEQFVFTNNWSSNRGMLSLAFDESKIKMGGNAVCGWKAMGYEKTVTKSEGNRVFTIDNVPAIEITAKYGGITDVSENNPNLFYEIATLCPLQLQRENAPPIMRPGLTVNWEDGSLNCSGQVPQGSKVKFSLPPDFNALEEVIQGCEEFKNNEMPEADALIYITCGGRLLTFGPAVRQEIEGVRRVWNAPMVGMFSNSELGRSKGGNLEHHNLSSCVVVLKEI